MKLNQFGKVSLTNAKKWAKATVANLRVKARYLFETTFPLFHVVLEAVDR